MLGYLHAAYMAANETCLVLRKARYAKERAEAYAKDEQEKTMTVNPHLYILTYDGSHKIKAIKALRAVLGVSLKDGKDICEGNVQFEHGILVSKVQTMAINGVYTEAFLFNDTLEPDRFHDFTFELCPPVEYRDDFSMHLPIRKDQP